jgi:signal transduction histidine kinase/ActR/RegA family two-component response regulator
MLSVTGGGRVNAADPNPPKAVARARLPILFGAMVAVMAAVIALLSQLQKDREAWVRHTLEVQTALSELSNSVYRVEALERGYLITGGDNYVRFYQRERVNLPAQLAEVGALTADNGQQTAAVASLRAAVQRKLAELDGAIALRKAGATEAALATVKEGPSWDRQIDVARIMDQMRTAEDRLLAQRTREAQWLNLALLVGVGGAGLLMMGFAGLWVEQARKAGREIQTAYRDLSVANAELVSQMASRAAAENQVRQMQKMEAVGQLTGGIAHDFNNMLAVVIGNLNMIQRRLARSDAKPGDPKIAGFVDSALEGANRAATLTGRLLAFSRQQPLSAEPVEPNRLVSGMSDLLARTLGETIMVETVLGAGLWRTQTDAIQLESALINLAVNARDAMPDGGRLTIETANTYLDADYAAAEGAKPGQYVMIAVTDAGCGMSREVIDRALEPFFTTKPVGKGTGLGLSQVYGFVKQSGGHLKIYSEPDQGTTVKVYLPRLFAAEVPVEPPRPLAAAPSGDRRKVLLVEDDERVRAFAEEALRDLGYEVVAAESAAEALAQAARTPDVDLLLTDVVMPDINGRELAEQVLKLKPGLPVLYMTGFTRNAVVHNGTLDPGVNFMAKPFTVDQLAAKVREALDTVPNLPHA